MSTKTQADPSVTAMALYSPAWENGYDDDTEEPVENEATRKTDMVLN